MIITGGTAGLGLTSAIELANKGAHVIITARNAAKGDQALKVIRKSLELRNRQLPEAKVEYGIAENEDLHSIKSFAEWFLAKQLPLHVLMLNAGLAFVPFRLIEGVESTLFINHVAHHLLAALLLPTLEASAPSRVVVVSSDVHSVASALALEPPTIPAYNSIRAYGNSKLANILFARALQRRAGDRVHVNAVHPGAVATAIFTKHAPAPPWLKAVTDAAMPWLAQPPSRGALTQLSAAASPEVEERGLRGRYLVPVARPQEPSAAARDRAAEERLWEWTERSIASALRAGRRPA